MVVGYHHFRNPPFRYFCIPAASPIKPAITTLLGQDCSWAKFHVFVAKVTMESLGEGCVRMGVKKTYIYIFVAVDHVAGWFFKLPCFFSILLFYHFIIIEDMIHRAKTLPSMMFCSRSVDYICILHFLLNTNLLTTI